MSTRRGWFKLLTEGLKRLNTRAKKFNSLRAKAKSDTSLSALDPTARRKAVAGQHERMQAEALVNGVDVLRVAVSCLSPRLWYSIVPKANLLCVVGHGRASDH